MPVVGVDYYNFLIKDSKWCSHALYSKINLVWQLIFKAHLGKLELHNFLTLLYLTFSHNALLCSSEGLL